MALLTSRMLLFGSKASSGVYIGPTVQLVAEFIHSSSSQTSLNHAALRIFLGILHSNWQNTGARHQFLHSVARRSVLR